VTRGKALDYGKLELSGKTAIYAVIGDPVNHSMSPLIQNTAFRSTGIDAVYVPFRVKQSTLKSAVAGLRSVGVKGFNVTLPHKIRILKYLDRLDRRAAEVGSVNTVANRNGSLLGYNTDGIGAVNALTDAGATLDDKSVLLFGAGGAGKAIAFAVAPRAKTILLANRTLTNAKQLGNQLRKKFEIEISHIAIPNPKLQLLVKEFDVIINASSMGMTGRRNLPINADSISSNQWIMDIVYKPIETKLLKNAELAGAHTVNGLDMLVTQGAASFELWTGKRAPVSEMRRAIAGKLLAMVDA
jgi:shikimate dehydrogenase